MKLLILIALCVVGSFAAELTGDNASILRSTWAQVSHNEVGILANFFEQYPQHQSRFPAFVGKDLASLKETAPFAVHSTRIVSKLSEIISLVTSSDNHPARKKILYELGSTHRDRGISKEAFDDFSVSLMDFLSKNVSWGDNVAAAWNEALRLGYYIIYFGLDGKEI